MNDQNDTQNLNGLLGMLLGAIIWTLTVAWSTFVVLVVASCMGAR